MKAASYCGNLGLVADRMESMLLGRALRARRVSSAAVEADWRNDRAPTRCHRSERQRVTEGPGADIACLARPPSAAQKARAAKRAKRERLAAKRGAVAEVLRAELMVRVRCIPDDIVAACVFSKHGVGFYAPRACGVNGADTLIASAKAEEMKLCELYVIELERRAYAKDEGQQAAAK